MIKQNLLFAIFLLSFFGAYAQQGKPSIAVALPHIEGLKITSTMAAKLIQLELIKMEKFSVYDEFDMAEIIKDSTEFTTECHGVNCLYRLGKALNVDNVVSGSFDGLGNKIAISLKWVDIHSGTLKRSIVREFDNQEDELQRMVEILLKEIQDMQPDNALVERLRFKNELITSNNVGRINNSGPRIGYAMLVGDMYEFAKRPAPQGGLSIFPGVSMIGYQIEGQYVGTENFSALIEGIINFSGLEQGVFIPSITVLNGFRFGKGGWEFAFGPGFGLKRESKGFFDTENYFGQGENYYYSEADWREYSFDNYGADSSYLDMYGGFSYPSAQEITGDNNYAFTTNYDKRGAYKFSTQWVFAFGRTFRAGALNIPVNIFYSSSRGGGMTGVSVGFNVERKKKKINNRR